MTYNKFSAILIVTVFVSGCSGSHFGKGGVDVCAAVGTSIGGTKGAVVHLLCNALTAFGENIAKEFNEKDKDLAERSGYEALEYTHTKETRHWKNVQSGHEGTITPVKTFRTPKGDCRQFKETVKIGNKNYQTYGIACKDKLGDWQLSNDKKSPLNARIGTPQKTSLAK